MLDLDEDNIIDFKSKDKQITGFGWNDLDGTNGKNLEGYQSTILFRVKGKKCLKESSIKFQINKYYANLSLPIELSLIINKDKKEDIVLNKNSEFTFKFNCNLNTVNTIEINVKNPQSLFDLKRGLNRIKKSIILNSISIND